MTATAGNISQTSVDARRPQWLLGMLIYSALLDSSKTMVNKFPQADQISTYTVTTETDGFQYQLSINGEVVSYTAQVGDTTTDVATGLVAAVNTDPIARGAVTATSAAAILTLTGNAPGQTFTLVEVSTPSKGTITLVQSAANADPVPFAVGMISGGWSTEESWEFGIRASQSAFVAQVTTLTVTYVAATIYEVALTVQDQEYEFEILADTSSTVTAAALVAAINAALPANTILASNVAGVVTLTAEIIGDEFKVAFGTSTGSSLALAYTTGPSTSTSVARAFAGVSRRRGDEANTTPGFNDVVYAPNEDVQVVSRGVIAVAESSGTTVTPGSQVWIELVDATTKGQFYAAGSGTARVLLAPNKALLQPVELAWERNARPSSGINLAALAVQLPR